VLNDPSKVIKMSISQLAKEAGARSEASVVRFYRTIGFESFSDLKLVSRRDFGRYVLSRL